MVGAEPLLWQMSLSLAPPIQNLTDEGDKDSSQPNGQRYVCMAQPSCESGNRDQGHSYQHAPIDSPAVVGKHSRLTVCADLLFLLGHGHNALWRIGQNFAVFLEIVRAWQWTGKIEVFYH